METGVFVLGMDRSGTSAVTGVIHLLGLQTPPDEDVVRPRETNPKGVWESASLVALNRRVLAAVGSDERFPDALEDGWENDTRLELLRQDARGTFRNVFPASPWVWKDPLLCLTFAFWRSVLSVPPVVVLVNRNPLAIAASALRAWDRGKIYGLALWERYLREALRQIAGARVLVTNYDELLSAPHAWAEQTHAFLDSAGVPARAGRDRDVLAYVDAGLRHAEFTRDDVLADGDVSEAQRGLFLALEGLEGTHDAFSPPILPSETPTTDVLLAERRQAFEMKDELERLLELERRSRMWSKLRRSSGVRRPVRLMRTVGRRARTEVDWLASRGGASDLAVFHDFHAPPYGGGNQFLIALVAELRRRRLAVEVNRLSGRTPACLYNSFNFDFTRLRRFARDGTRMVHRVDGPIGVYRGFDDGTDRRIADINRSLADATVFQSRYSLDKHRELGFDLRNPVVIPNSVDPDLFHPPAAREPLANRRLRVIATSWSDNPRKGTDVLAWVDRNLDFDSFEVTFAGQTRQRFERIRVVGPLPSAPLADLLRAHDVFLAASRDDPCSNALLEALACGLPAAFRRSGGHPELVGDAGIGFDDPEELPGVLTRVRGELEERRAAIRVAPIAEVADRYLEVLRA